MNARRVTTQDEFDQAPDWRVAKPGQTAPTRRLPKAVRKALRDYRRKIIPMTDHDECSWCVLVLIGIAAVAILLASAWGLMP